MMPRGSSARTRSTDTSCRAIWQKTFCSRTRRAMSWPYCEPKSRIRMRSVAGKGVISFDPSGMLILPYTTLFLLVRELGPQLGQGSLVIDVAITNKALNFDLNLVSIG